jgi:exopolysaccharide production protein ExoQ
MDFERSQNVQHGAIHRHGSDNPPAAHMTTVHERRLGIERHRVVPAVETAFVVSALLLYWTDILRLLFPGDTGEISATFRLSYFVLYGIAVALIARRWDLAWAAIKVTPLLMLFLAMPLLSTLWSINPQETFNRSIAVMGSSAFGIYVATQIGQHRTLGLLALTATIAASLSLVLIVAAPSVGITQVEEYFGTWKGAYGHKNGFGQMTALGAITCVLAALNFAGRDRMVFAAGFGLNLFLLAGSKSLTAQILVVVCLVAIFAIGRFVGVIVRNAGLIALLVLPLLIWFALAFSVDDALQLIALFGKDANLSSRLPMWQSLMPFIDERFWLGFGYSAFWNDGTYTVAIITERLRFRPYYAHNGLIELWLGLGAVGVALFAAVFGRFVYLAIHLLVKDGRNPIYLLSFAFAIIMVLQNTAESTILLRNSMSWTLFVMLSVYLSVDARRRLAAPGTASTLNKPGALPGKPPLLVV